MTDKQIIIDAFNSAWNRKVATESSYGKLASKEVFENNNEDKQITIDNVDVSGCGSYMDNGECINENVYPDYCKACSNCTYKLEQQLKRKEQKCEELKNTLEEIQRIANSGQRSSDLFVRNLAETIFATASEVLDV